MKTRWLMQSILKKHYWETANKYAVEDFRLDLPEEQRLFKCARPIRPILDDPLTNPQAGDVGSTGNGVMIGRNPRIRQESA